MTQISPLDHAAVDLATAQLRDVEGYLRPRLRAFLEAGLALMAIRERRLHLQAGFDTFELYCRERWGIDASHARRMCDAAQVAHIAASTNGPAGVNVENEAQARELAPLIGRPDRLQEVWQRTVERAEQAGTTVTAPLIRQVRKEYETGGQPAPGRRTPPPPPRPSPVQVVPAEARRVFLLITQAVEEARALGGTDVFRADISPEVRSAWGAELAAASGFVVQLAEACAGRMT